MKSVVENIYRYMDEEKAALTNLEILEQFFKMEKPDPAIALRIVGPLLDADPRFERSGNGWRARVVSSVEDLPVEAAPFVLFSFVPPDGKGGEVRLEHAFLLLLRGGEAGEIGAKGGDSDGFTALLRDAGRYIFVPYDRKSLTLLKRLYRAFSPLDPELKTVSIARLITHLYPEKKYRRWEDIIEDFSLVNYESDSPVSRVKTLRRVFEHVLGGLSPGITTAGGLVELSNAVNDRISFSRYGFDRDFLRGLPERPGVYLFLNREDRIVYVGKTVNLKNRVGSYFRVTGEREEKREELLQTLYTIQYRVLGSDLEALVEEHRLIDRHRPLFNTRVEVPERVVEAPDRIIVLPSAQEESVKLYLVSNGLPLMEHDMGPAGAEEWVGTVMKKLGEAKEYVFDPAKIIALVYLKRYEEHINTVDIYGYESSAGVVRALDYYRENRERLSTERITIL